MKTVAELLRGKPDRAVYSVAPDSSVLEAAALMQRQNIGALLVLDAEQRLVGIVSERDLVRKMLLAERSARTTPVHAIMTPALPAVHPAQSNEDCMALMTNERLRHLPVIDAGRLVGLLSIGDLVKDLLSEQEFIIHQLEHYIAGDRH